MDLPVASSTWSAVAMIHCFACTFTTSLSELCECLYHHKDVITRFESTRENVIVATFFCNNQKRAIYTKIRQNHKGD